MNNILLIYELRWCNCRLRIGCHFYLSTCCADDRINEREKQNLIYSDRKYSDENKWVGDYSRAHKEKETSEKKKGKKKTSRE